MKYRLHIEHSPGVGTYIRTFKSSCFLRMSKSPKHIYCSKISNYNIYRFELSLPLFIQITKEIRYGVFTKMVISFPVGYQMIITIPRCLLFYDNLESLVFTLHSVCKSIIVTFYSRTIAVLLFLQFMDVLI